MLIAWNCFPGFIYIWGGGEREECSVHVCFFRVGFGIVYVEGWKYKSVKPAYIYFVSVHTDVEVSIAQGRDAVRI